MELPHKQPIEIQSWTDEGFAVRFCAMHRLSVRSVLALRVRFRTKHQAQRAETLRTKPLKNKMRDRTPPNTDAKKLPWRISGKRGFYARLVGSLSAGGQDLLGLDRTQRAIACRLAEDNVDAPPNPHSPLRKPQQYKTTPMLC